MIDWQSLVLWVLGCAQGMVLGWMLWRKPNLKYKEDEE
jgi:hypothetical protein